MQFLVPWHFELNRLGPEVVRSVTQMIMPRSSDRSGAFKFAGMMLLLGNFCFF